MIIIKEMPVGTIFNIFRQFDFTKMSCWWWCCLCITYNLQSYCVAHMWNCIHLEKITLWMSKKGYLNDLSDESDGVQNPSNLPNKANLITADMGEGWLLMRKQLLCQNLTFDSWGMGPSVVQDLIFLGFYSYLTLIQPCVSRCCCLEKNIYSNEQKQRCFGGK